jgi:hypothetical protein
MFSSKATEKYIKIPQTVTISKKRWAEPGEPSKLLLFAKLESPTLSYRIRTRISKIRTRLVKIPTIIK